MHQAIIVITLGPRSSIQSITRAGSARASTFVREIQAGNDEIDAEIATSGYISYNILHFTSITLSFFILAVSIVLARIKKTVYGGHIRK
jgi:hypothetical protein